jgi:fumarylacetoacetase
MTDGFGLDHLPYGVFSPGGAPRMGVRFGDHVLDPEAALADECSRRRA